MDTKKSIRIFLADDHPLLRTGLKFSLDQNEEVELIGEAEDGYDAIKKIRKDPPDVALIDMDMPGLSGAGTIRVLRKMLPDMKILVLSNYSDDTYIQSAMDAGADGYVLKCVGIDELVKIIKSVWTEKSELSPYLVNLTKGYQRDDKPRLKKKKHYLTQREQEVLQLIAQGKGNKEISKMLFISTETVKSHVKNIFKKLNIKNRVEATVEARRHGIVA